MAKILVIRLTSLGDVIFTLPLVNTLAQNNEVGYLVSEKGLKIVQNNPDVSKVHFVPLAQWKKRPFSLKTLFEFIKIIKELRNEYYDIAIDCQQMFKSLFLFWFCGAKRRITAKGARELSFLGANEFVKQKAKFRDYNYHIVERNLDFARYLGIEPKEKTFSLPQSSQETVYKIADLTRGIVKEKPIVVIAPATTWDNKHWAVQNWAKVLDNIGEKCNIIFTGTLNDQRLLDQILSCTTKRFDYLNLLGQTNLEELKELFSRANIVISPDSGSANLAWASQNPAIITIFTCTPSKRFGPYGNNDKYYTVQSNLPCQPCFKKKCMLRNNKNACQFYPNADEIINIVNKILS